MKKLWLILFALLIPYLTGCVQVEVSLSSDNGGIVDVGQYSFGREKVLDAMPICPLTTTLESQKQNTGVWCWAASAQMVINYLRAVNEPPLVRFRQCYIASIALTDTAIPPAIPPPPPDCCMAEDSFVPEESPPDPAAYKLKLDKAQRTCRERLSPLIALKKNGYTAEQSSPLLWEGLTDQLCTKQTPYIIVVRFYDDDGSLAGAHSSVVGGARMTPDGDRYVEVSDHSEDDFFLMKWEAFKAGVPGDFDHVNDYIDIKHQPN